MKKITSLALSFVALLLIVVLSSAGKQPKRLFMCGDSTMADKTELEISPERGWGQLFPTYLSEDLIVENHAMNGRSTHSFLQEGRWDSVCARIHKGDIVMLQFGHNDAKVSDTTRYASVADYERNLVRMAKEAQKKGASVIICTPINRRSFSAETGKFISKHGAYPEAARRVAKSLNLPLLDLEAATREWLEGLGDEGSKPYFMNVAPGECLKFPDGKIDNTHLRENGALEVGRMAVDLIQRGHIKCLQSYIVAPSATPKYTTFSRPTMPNDKKPVESDQKGDLK